MEILKDGSLLPDLILIDIVMPGVSGLDLLEEIKRKDPRLVIIMTTAHGTTDRAIRAMKLGAYDYISKPFRQQELLARIGAVIRRSEWNGIKPGFVRVDDDISIDFGRCIMNVRGTEVRLRPTENRLLYRLITNAGHILSHESLLKNVWGPEYKGLDQYVWLYITHLRRKIEKDPENPEYILGWRGIGYYFKDFRFKGRRRGPRKRPQRGAK